MKILTKLMLASAVMVTSGFAAGTTINENTPMRGGWDIKGTDAAMIAAEKTVTMQGEDGADSDLNIKDTASLTINGTLKMYDASAVTVENGSTCTNNGILDVQYVTNFSRYSGTVSGSNGSVVFVPYPNNEEVTAQASANAFTVSVDQTSGSEVKVRYKTDNAELKTNETTVFIEVDGGRGTYADVAAVTTKTGIAFDDAANNAVLDPIGKPNLTFAEVLADEVNAAANVAKTFDVGQAGLSDRNLNTAAATTIHFGLAGDDKDVFQYETGALEVKGDSSGMNGGIGTNGDLKFTGKAANGNMDVQGALTLGYQGEQELAGEIKAGAINIPAGSKVVLKNKLTTGWSALKEINLDTSDNIRDYAVSSLHRGTIPGFESTVYYQNTSGDNTGALFYRDASSDEPDILKETFDLSEYCDVNSDSTVSLSFRDVDLTLLGFNIYDSRHDPSGDGEDNGVELEFAKWLANGSVFFEGSVPQSELLNLEGKFRVPVNGPHFRTVDRLNDMVPQNSDYFNANPTMDNVAFIIFDLTDNSICLDRRTSPGVWRRVDDVMNELNKTLDDFVKVSSWTGK